MSEITEPLPLGREPIFSVSDALVAINQSLEYAFPTITVVGEVSSHRVSQGKWVFFDIKDDEASLGCFMSLFNLRVAIEDGMQVAVVARPSLTKWGKFSLTVQSIRPVGEGSIKRAFELLHAKLDKEGLFALERKRALPQLPTYIGVISSTDAAGYADFVKILNERFGGIKVTVAHVQVQGDMAPAQIIAALDHFNQLATPPEVIAILRGGGSADDLMAFNDERLVRAIVASRAPTITGVGHETDVTLADLAADMRAATPSNAAQILVPDRREIMATVDANLKNLLVKFENNLLGVSGKLSRQRADMLTYLEQIISDSEMRQSYLSAVLKQLDPRTVLNRGYSIVRDAKGKIVTGGNVGVGERLTIENAKCIIKAEVKNARQK